MDFDKDNFDDDNELAPLEEEEAGEVDEVVGAETDAELSDDEGDEEPPTPKRGSTSPKRGSTSGEPSGRTASKAPVKKAAVKKSPAKKAKKAAKKPARKKSAKKPAKKAGGKKKKR